MLLVLLHGNLRAGGHRQDTAELDISRLNTFTLFGLMLLTGAVLQLGQVIATATE